MQKPILFFSTKIAVADFDQQIIGSPAAIYIDNLNGLLYFKYSPNLPSHLSIESPSQISPKLPFNL